MPPQQISPPPPIQPEPIKSGSFFERKAVWVSVIVIILLGAGAYYIVQQQSLSQSASENPNSDAQALPTENQTQQQTNDASVQAPTNNSQPPTNTSQPTTVAANGKFALVPAKRQPVVISGNNFFDPEYGLNISYPAGWNAVLDKTYTNSDTQTIFLQRDSVKLAIQPSVFWYSSVADSHKKGESILKQKSLAGGTLFMVGYDVENSFSGRIFWGYQYPDGSWQIVTNILQALGFSETHIEQFGQKGIPTDEFLPKEEAKILADNVYASITIDPLKVRNLGRITELIRIAGALDLQEEYHGGIPRTSTMPQIVKAATYAFPTHNYNGTTQGVPYGWVDNSKDGGYCMYTRLESESPAEYYMISNVKRSQDYYSMSRGSYVTKPPKDMKECNQ
jgi:hypothetical protein